MFIVTAFDLRAYSKDATAVKGKLEDVIWNYDSTLDLCIDGDTYTLSKDSLYSSRSFGVLNDMPLSKLVDVLDSYTGQRVSLEYVPLALEIHVYSESDICSSSCQIAGVDSEIISHYNDCILG